MKAKDSVEMETIAREIGDRIKARRTHLGLRQTDLASESGLSRRSIQYYEAGVIVPHSMAVLGLCKSLRISPNVLLGSRR
jgi:transcriptional regulator with XRE-family HTH domain